MQALRLCRTLGTIFTFLFIGFVWGQSEQWELRVCAEPRSLPFSDRRERGFENKIAEILASELNARLTYAWLPQPYVIARDIYLETGRCDMVTGIPDGTKPFLTTLAYYRTSYVFVYQKGGPGEIASFDDSRLKLLEIGVQSSGSSISPVSYALAKRGLVEQQHNYRSDFKAANPLAAVVKAVAQDEVDVGIVWGPIAGYFSQAWTGLEWVPVSPQIERPFIPMTAPISIGLRQGDEDLRDLFDYALVQRWEDIKAILKAYRVPLGEPQPTKPLLTLGSP